MASSASTSTTTSRFRRTEILAMEIGQRLLGTACLIGGVVLTLTLILLPVGIPLSLMGIALMMASSESS